MSIQAWYASAVAERNADTLIEINDDPTTVAVQRAGVDRGTLTVRLVPVGTHVNVARGDISAAVTETVGVVAPAGTDLVRGDLLAVTGGAVYRVRFVLPGQKGRIEAEAEVVG